MAPVNDVTTASWFMMVAGLGYVNPLKNLDKIAQNIATLYYCNIICQSIEKGLGRRSAGLPFLV